MLNLRQTHIPGVSIIRRLGVLTCLLLALTVATKPSVAAEQQFPDQPLHFIVPYGVGGGPDSLTRMISQYLGKKWGQATVAENRPGASGVIGFGVASRAKPDGYTVLFADSTIVAINPHLRPQMTGGKDVFQIFAPLTLAATAPMLLVVSPKFKAKSLSELIALVKSQPGKFSYGTPGSGTPQHIAMELLMRETGMQMVHVPFGSVQAAAPSLISGDIAMMFATTTPVLGLLQSGGLRAIAAGGSERLAGVPNVPTFAGAGLPNFKATINFGYLIPAGTPEKTVQKLQVAIAAALKTPEASKWLAAQGMQGVGSSPQSFEAISRTESEDYGRVIKAAGIKVD